MRNRMKYMARVAIGLAGTSWLLGVSAGAVVAQRPYQAAIDSARAVLRQFVVQEGVVGLSIAIGVEDSLVWAEGFGYADRDARMPVTPDTRFRVGSISKSLTAAAVGLLVERGHLDLDAPVQRYVPSFPRKPWVLTTRHLAGHLGGVRHYRGSEFLSQRHYETVAEGLTIFEDDSLLFEPGTRYSYSSYGWNLVSAVVEGASRQPFLGFMRREVLDPLGLSATVAEHVDSAIPNVTNFYERGDDGVIADAPFVDNSYKWAGGGFLSTPSDLVRFAFAHLRPGFLRPKTIELLWTSQRTRDGEVTGYGIGWRVGRNGQDRRVVSHSGGSVGGRSLLLIYPEERVVLAVTANTTPLSYGRMPQQIVDLFLR